MHWQDLSIVGIVIAVSWAVSLIALHHGGAAFF